MTYKPKLELTWIGKDEELKLEPRILIEDQSKSYGDPKSENMLIHGDNLLALKALEQNFAGKIKCIYIDPPYNTGSAFEHYDDNLEHSTWLSLMRPRLEMLRILLRNDGTIWVNLDDNESHYCKVMCDEIFGRRNFLANVVWEKADSPNMDSRYFSSRHDNLLVYAKNVDIVKIKRILNDGDPPAHYDKTDENGERYYLKPLRAMGVDGYREKRPSMYFPVTAPDGTEVYPKNRDGSDSRWRWGLERVKQDKQRLEWIKTKKGWSLYFRIYFKDSIGSPPETIWHHQEVGTNRTSKKEIKDLFSSDIFGTPKPERLLSRVISVSTELGDWVLDSFLGSGTTSAVANKMGRKWIGIEMGDHAYSHCKVRLDKVIDGSDQGGISKTVNWKGGGAYKFYELAPSLLRKDKYGNFVIDEKYNANMLAAAMCKHEGFKYFPDAELYWKQGKSTETDYIFVTTSFMTVKQIDKIHEEMKPAESLLICAKSFATGGKGRHSNITIKKIPKMILGKCEFGKDNYDLNIIKTNDQSSADSEDDE
ncbi:site-specific DNA-methyltransferase [bacterium]|nr:site-specific DNA-methyltransferase [bacterium]